MTGAQLLSLSSSDYMVITPVPSKADQFNVAFVISLSVPIQQGQQRYAHLVMQLPQKNHIMSVNLDEDEITENYGANSLRPEMSGELHKLVAKTFKVSQRCQAAYRLTRLKCAQSV